MSNPPSLFDPEEPEEDPPAVLDAAAAKAAKDEAMARVEANAAAVWKAHALDMILTVATAHAYFTTDDLWAAGLLQPHQPRALGPMMSEAAKRGWIRKTDRVRNSERAVAHAGPKAIWESRLWRPA